MNAQANELIGRLGLVPHPEGGYYRETYRAPLQVQSPLHTESRSAFTSIHFLLADGQFSAWHRVASDESWFFHLGCDLEIYLLDPTADSSKSVVTVLTLGSKSGAYEATVPAGHWFAARPIDPAGFSFVSCVVSPGFVFEDFELASQDSFIAMRLDCHPDWPFIQSLLVRQTG